jgi:hypothetical protein
MHPSTGRNSQLRKAIAAAFVSAGLLVTVAPTAGALAEPPRGSCNRGTMNAHETVPHLNEGTHTAHMHIPNCEEV